MSDVLHVSKRTTRGTSHAKRERAAGKIPAILYGHGEDNVALIISKEELDAVIRHGAQVVELQGAVAENAFIRDVQWDAFGVDVMHIDFTRVSKGEKVETTVSIELRGEAPGAKKGGTVTQTLHELEINCPAMKIPEKIEVTINELEVGDTIVASQLELPEGAELLGDPDAPVVSCEEIVEVEEEDAAEALPGEPEVIGAKDDDEQSEADG